MTIDSSWVEGKELKVTRNKNISLVTHLSPSSLPLFMALQTHQQNVVRTLLFTFSYFYWPWMLFRNEITDFASLSSQFASFHDQAPKHFHELTNAGGNDEELNTSAWSPTSEPVHSDTLPLFTFPLFDNNRTRTAFFFYVVYLHLKVNQLAGARNFSFSLKFIFTHLPDKVFDEAINRNERSIVQKNLWLEHGKRSRHFTLQTRAFIQNNFTRVCNRRQIEFIAAAQCSRVHRFMFLNFTRLFCQPCKSKTN